jgi:hypothetical protein
LTQACSPKLTHRIWATVWGYGGRRDPISETVGPGRIDEFGAQVLEDEQAAFQGGAIDLV